MCELKPDQGAQPRKIRWKGSLFPSNLQIYEYLTRVKIWGWTKTVWDRQERDKFGDAKWSTSYPCHGVQIDLDGFMTMSTNLKPKTM